MNNNKSERRIRNNRIRRQKEMRRHFLMFVMTFCLVLIFSFSISGFLSKAKATDESEENYVKYYKSIVISKEDTLWSIAQEYMDEEHYESVEDYIKEVKQTNHLNSDIITYGTYLIVPYYTS